MPEPASPPVPADEAVPPGEAPTGDGTEPRRRPALSPSRAGDFRVCPLLYRFRAVDRLPEVPSRAQIRGVLVHTVIERLFAEPATTRTPAAAAALVPVVWAELVASAPGLAELLFPAPAAADDEDLGSWLAGAVGLLDSWFALEDPRTFDPQDCELLVETELRSGTPLRGVVDRLDAGPGGALRVVDYKTGFVPGERGEAAAMFQLKFYALALLQLRGVVPVELRLLYLRDGGRWLSYSPDEPELRRFERVLDALWSAILRAGREGDFPPSPGPACGHCSHRAVCPAWDGTPPPYPGWPQEGSAPAPTPVGAPG